MISVSLRITLKLNIRLSPHSRDFLPSPKCTFEGLRTDWRSKALDADDKLRLRHTEHTRAWAVVLDAEIDDFWPLFEKTPCRELLDPLDRS